MNPPKDKHTPGEPLWQQEVRKMGGDALVEVLSEIKECQNKMAAKINGMGDEIESHLEAHINKAFAGGDAEGHRRARMGDEIESHLEAHINKAFAGGDAEGHRRAHEAMINLIEEKRRLRVAIQEKTISGLIWAGIMFVGLAIFNEVRKAILGG